MNPPLDPSSLASSGNGKGETEILGLILEQMKALSLQNAALQAKVCPLSFRSGQGERAREGEEGGKAIRNAQLVVVIADSPQLLSPYVLSG
jgi:hypothetical protein